MPRWAVGLLVVLTSLAGATTRSLVDPPVTLDVAAQPLSLVLAEVTRQTGVPFELPFRSESSATRAERDPNLDAVRARFDPPVTLAVADLPLHAALRRLAAAGGVRFAARAAGPALTVVPQLATPAEAGPAVSAGDYTIHLDGLRAERIRERVWAPEPAQQREDRLRLWLSVDAPTTLDLVRIQGLAPDVEALLDGEPLVLTDPPSTRYPSGAGGSGGSGLTFRLPDHDVQALTRLDARLIVATQIEELIFEFQALETPNQRLSDGDVEVTLQRWRHVQTDPTGDEAHPERPPAWLADLAVSRPLGDTLRARLTPWLPSVAGPRRADGGVRLPVLPPARLAAPPVPDVGAPWSDARGGMGAVLPVVVVETSAGRRLMAGLTGLRDVRVDTDRLAFATTAALPEFEGEPKRLLVAVLVLSEATTRLPFRFTEVELPGAAPAR